jgi:hypothetical protein
LSGSYARSLTSQDQNIKDEASYDLFKDHLSSTALHQIISSLALWMSAVLGYHFAIRDLISTLHSAPQIKKTWNHALHSTPELLYLGSREFDMAF